MKRIRRLLAALTALCLLTGCTGLSYTDLYSLPRASEDYYDLQEALSGILNQGYSYLAPASGARQEPVQLTDLDGDGVDEALAFFRSADKGEVKVYIFSQSEGVYTPAAVIDGAGDRVASVEYADLDGSGNLELIVACQVSESVTQALQIYRYSGGEAANMLTTGCSRYGLYDLSGDGLPELICLSSQGADEPATAECYGCASGELVRLGEQRLRFPYDSLRKIQRGVLADGAKTAAYSGLNAEGTLLTDLFTVERDAFLAVQPEADILNAAPVHGYYVYPEDLDGDGRLEIPQTRQLPALDEGSAAQWVVDWYGVRSDGGYEKKLTAYHNFSEDWYLELLPAWEENLTIKAGDENATASTVTLYQTGGAEGPREILTIYTLRGAQRNAYAEEHSLTILNSDSDNETIFAVTLAAAELWEGTVTNAQISEMFHYSRSQTGS